MHPIDLDLRIVYLDISTIITKKRVEMAKIQYLFTLNNKKKNEKNGITVHRPTCLIVVRITIQAAIDQRK